MKNKQLHICPIIGFLLIASFSDVASAASLSQTEKNAANDLAIQVVECAVFYGFTAICIERVQNDKGYENAATVKQKLMENMMFAEHVVPKLTQLAGLLPETVDARKQLIAKSMASETNGDCGNISILMAKYLHACSVYVNEDVPNFMKAHGG